MNYLRYGLDRRKKIKVAMIAPFPAASVLKEEYIKRKVRKKAKLQHPAPWVKALCNELVGNDNIDLEIFSHSRHILRTHCAIKEGIKFTFFPKYEPLRSDPYHFHLPAIAQFSPRIKKYNPDIIHGFGTEGAYGLITVLQNKPSVVFIQGIQEKYAPYYDLHRLKIKLRMASERYVVGRVNGLIAETDFAARWVKSIAKQKEVKIIPHAYTAHFFNCRPKFEKKRIACIGTLSQRKGCDVVLESFVLGLQRNQYLFNDSELCFYGDGPMRRTLQKRTEELKLNHNVKFFTGVTHSKIPEEIEKASILVIGSRVDTSPNVVTEAHAAGIPVVGTDGGGIPEMVDNGVDGYIVPVDDCNQMSQRLEKLLSNLDLCRALGSAGRMKVKKLNNPSRIADSHVEFYRELIDRKPL
jgi:glycosyltransferase involved in cell wall biosynthesis